MTTVVIVGVSSDKHWRAVKDHPGELHRLKARYRRKKEVYNYIDSIKRYPFRPERRAKMMSPLYRFLSCANRFARRSNSSSGGVDGEAVADVFLEDGSGFEVWGEVESSAESFSLESTTFGLAADGSFSP